jgi:hypothetical protein
MAAEIPTGAQIARMTDGERASLVGWLSTERAHEATVQKSSSARAETKKREADVALAEVEASRTRARQLDEASAYLSGSKKAEL